MKRLNYILYMFFAMSLLLVSCDDDDPVEEKEEEKVVDYGDVDAMFEARLLTGELITEIDMGETFSLSDISGGRPDTRVWTVTSADGSVNLTLSDAKVQSFYFPVGNMTYDVKLAVERTSDGQTDELVVEDYIQVNHIDVVADFVASGPNDDDGAGDFTVGRTLPVTFLNKSKGAPDELTWEFEEGTPLTSDENHQAVVFNKDGLFEVKLTATRSSDGSTSEVTKMIRVIQEYMDIESTSISNRAITLMYNQVIMEDPTVAKDDIMVEIHTAAGTTINAGIESISSSDNTLIVMLDQDTYHNDVVTLTYDGGSASLVGADPAFIARTMNKTHAVEKNNMFFHGEYDGGFDNWEENGTEVSRTEGGRSKYNFEVSDVRSLSGGKSGYFEVGYNGDSYADILQKVGTYHDIAPGEEYQVGFWIYIEEMENPSLAMSIYWRFGVPTWWNGANSYALQTVTETGKWVYVSGTVGTGLATGTNAHFMWRIKDAKYKIYMDNMKMYPAGTYRTRP